MAEPETFETVCKRCGGPAIGFVLRMRRSVAITRANPEDAEIREARVGGEVCLECADRDERIRDEEKAYDDRRDNLKLAQLPAELHEIDWRGFPQREATRLAWRWSTGRLAGLCLTGDVGVGKTWLAAAALWSALDRRPVRWVDTAQLISSLRASFGDDHRAEALRVVNGRGAAVFDDLDKVTPSDYAREALYAALNARVVAGSPLLITTNEPLSASATCSGKPIMSRLAGYCTVVEMLGPDRRVQRPELRAA